MKTVAIIPIKSRSTRVKKKNFKKVMGKPLYTILLDKIKKCNFDEVYVDTDSPEIQKYCIKKKITVISRLPELAKDTANGNDLLNHHQKIIKADIYFQLFVTSPLISINTINSCIKIIKKSKKYDSILTSRKIYTWFWFNKKPINYNPVLLPRSQDAKPITVETTALYGIKAKSLKKRKCRIGYKPYFYNISEKESVDLDNEIDFVFLKSVLKKNNF